MLNISAMFAVHQYSWLGGLNLLTLSLTAASGLNFITGVLWKSDFQKKLFVVVNINSLFPYANHSAPRTADHNRNAHLISNEPKESREVEETEIYTYIQHLPKSLIHKDNLCRFYEFRKRGREKSTVSVILVQIHQKHMFRVCQYQGMLEKFI